MRKELFKVLGLFVVLSLIFFYPIFKGQIPFPGDLLVSYYEPYKAYPILGYQPGAVPTKYQDIDVARHIFPWKHFAIDSLKKNQIPFWNPHNFSGNPLMANFQSGVFYPLNILMFFPFLTGWTIYIILSPILSSFFMYLFLRQLKLTKLSSIFGGIAFAFSSFMVVWMEYGNIDHTFLWLPLALLWTDKFIRKLNYRYIIFLTLTLTVSFLAGYIQSFFYLIVAVSIYFLAKSLYEKSLTLRNFFIFFLGIIFPILLSSFQLLPTLELFSNSSRNNYTLSQIQNLLNPWWYLITVIAPNFFGNPATGNHWFYGTYIERVSYIGVIPFCLFLYAMFNFKKRIEIKIFGLIAFVSLFLSTDFLITRYFNLIPIPVISTTVPTRMLSLFQFGAIILASIGLDFFRKNVNKKYLSYSIIIVFIILLSSFVFTFLGSRMFDIDSANLIVSRRNLIPPAVLVLTFAVLAYLWLRFKSKLILLGILLITFADLFYFFNKITPFSPTDFVYPKTPVVSFLKEKAGINRFWGYGSGYIESDFQTFDGTYSPEGVDALHTKYYTELISSSKDGKISNIPSRMDANLAPGYGKESLRDNWFRQRLLNLLGVKYVLNKSGSSAYDDAFDPKKYELVWHDGTYQIYENREVLPRAFLASNYIVENDRSSISKIYDHKLDLGQTLILEEDPKLKLGKDLNSFVKIMSYSSNRITLETSAKTNTLLFLSDTYFPDWEVSIDGVSGKIYRADFAFRAVPLKAGKHTVVFDYGAYNFKEGLGVSIFSLLVFVSGSIFLIKRKYVRI